MKLTGVPAMLMALAATTSAFAQGPDPRTVRAQFELCAKLYFTGRTQEALLACDRAIAADPKNADAYFILGSLLVGDTKVQNGKYIVRSDTVGVLKQYLVLAPNGSHAADVKAMLEALK